MADLPATNASELTVINLQQTLASERQQSSQMIAFLKKEGALLKDQIATRDRKIEWMEKSLASKDLLLLQKQQTIAAKDKQQQQQQQQQSQAPGNASEQMSAATRTTRPLAAVAAAATTNTNTNTNSARPTKQAKKETWDMRFDELVAYKKAHGTFNTTQKRGGKHNGLNQWIEYQRKKYKQNRERFDPQRLARLESISFPFVRKSEHFLTFDERLQQLLGYKAKTGHCNVPQDGKGAPKGLGHFVLDQRKYFHQMRRVEGKKTPLTQERIDKLNALGFQWTLKRSGATKQEEESESEGDKDYPGSTYWY
jgi:hypothetical protein